MEEPKIEQVGNLYDTDSFGGNPMRGRVYGDNGLAPTLRTFQGGALEPKVVRLAMRGRGESGNTEQRIEPRKDDLTNTITTVQKDNLVSNNNIRIRKLTPRECFRLMGVEDADIDKIQAAGISDSQQYKMAGNSIVVDVLYHIFRKMLTEQQREEKQLTLF